MAVAEVARLVVEANEPDVWRVFGLNVFCSEPTRIVADPLSPYRHWFSQLIGNGTVAALVGEEALELEEWPGELDAPRVAVNTSIYAGRLHDASHCVDTRPLLFLDVDVRSVITVLVDNCIKSYNALVVVIGGESKPLEEALNTFHSPQETKETLRELAQWVVITGHDSEYVEIWSRHQGAQSKLQACCDYVNERIDELIKTDTACE